MNRKIIPEIYAFTINSGPIDDIMLMNLSEYYEQFSKYNLKLLKHARISREKRDKTVKPNKHDIIIEDIIEYFYSKKLNCS